MVKIIISWLCLQHSNWILCLDHFNIVVSLEVFSSIVLFWNLPKVLCLSLRLPAQEINGLFNPDPVKHHRIYQRSRLPSYKAVDAEVDRDDLPGEKLSPVQVYCRLSAFTGRLQETLRKAFFFLQGCFVIGHGVVVWNWNRLDEIRNGEKFHPYSAIETHWNRLSNYVDTPFVEIFQCQDGIWGHLVLWNVSAHYRGIGQNDLQWFLPTQPDVGFYDNLVSACSCKGVKFTLSCTIL